MSWYLRVLTNFADFNNRAARTEYWMFSLISTVILAVLWILDHRFLHTAHPGVGLLSGAYALLVFVPTIAVSTRRLHDIGRSGWWQLLCFLPFVGGLVLLVFYVLAGTPGDNEYGADPKG
jgi:uncharacterized membrane protein YhaH (DUF805 family)